MAFRLPRLPKDISLVDKLGRVSVEFQRWWQKAMEAIENMILDLQEAIDRITTNETDIAALEAVTFTAGNGLTGGGGILTSPSFAVGAGTGIVVGADDVAVSAKLALYHGGDTPSAFTLSIVDSVDGAAWRTAIGAGTSSTTGTVTSVAATVPTGFSIAGSPVTTTGTLAITYTAGYQGYTTAEATKLAAITLGGNFTTSGAFNLTLTLTAATSVTLPTTGTLATLAGAETLTNKTLTAPVLNATPSSAWGLDFAPSTSANNYITIANNGTYDLASGAGMLFLVSDGSADMAQVAMHWGGTYIVWQQAATFTNTSGTGSKINVYYNGAGAYRIQNLTGGSVNLFVTTMRMRTSA